MRGFFGAQCMANGMQIWQKSTNLSLKFGGLIVGEIEQQFFSTNAVSRQFFPCRTKFNENKPQGSISSMLYEQLLCKKIPKVQKDSPAFSLFSAFGIWVHKSCS